MKTPILCAMAVFASTSAHAAVVAGDSNVTNNGGGISTFVFDQVSGDINGTGDGLSFTGGGTSFIATSGQGTVRQDYPSNGGLGVIASTGTDNLETNLGETLLLTFSAAVDIIGFTFNGTLGSNGHTDAASGAFSSSSGIGTISGDASALDGIGDTFGLGGTSLCSINIGFCSTTSILFSGSEFKGYLESITFKIAPGAPPVPLPASLGFLFAGMAGLGYFGRKKRIS